VEIEIGPLEYQFGHMIGLGLLEQTEGPDGGEGVFPGEGLGVVVEADDVGFPEA